MGLPKAKHKTADIVADIDWALENGEPYVLTRMADAEAGFLMLAAGYSLTGVKKEVLWDWGRIGLNNTAAVKLIVAGLPECDAFAIPTLEPWAGMWNMVPTIIDAFHAWGYELSEMPLTHHSVVRYMILRGEFKRWHGRRMVIINEDAEAVAEGLKTDMNIVGAVTLGRDEISAAVDRAAEYDFEIALLGVGVRKYAIAHRLADRTGRVVLDVGYVLNILSHVHPPKVGWTKAGAQKGNYKAGWKVAEGLLKAHPNEI